MTFIHSSQARSLEAKMSRISSSESAFGLVSTVMSSGVLIGRKEPILKGSV
jgi:hypothetical protein